MKKGNGKTIFEKSNPGAQGFALPNPHYLSGEGEIPTEYRRTDLPLPSLGELEVIRHYTNLSQLNHSIEHGFYPLGSCTMKYNPRINEFIANQENFAGIHPMVPAEECQGNLKILYLLEKFLCEIGGMDGFTLQPAAGSHGELVGMMVLKTFLRDKGMTHKDLILIPDSAHGTNPASAAMCGFRVETIRSNARGTVDLEDLKSKLSDKVAGMMLTNPNTCGLFENDIDRIVKMIHGCGGQLYYDGANLNAIVGQARPGDMGFDICHFNLHKTFSTPHGGGGPGSGPCGVKGHLLPYLPVPAVVESPEGYQFDWKRPKSIGKVHGFYGNFGINLRAFVYILSLGNRGLREVSETAVLNANYLKNKIKSRFFDPFPDQTCMHEFVLSAKDLKLQGISALDLSKALLDYGFHAPTMYFPQIIPECLMFEPTETESRETLDQFAAVLNDLVDRARRGELKLSECPKETPIERVDEAKAARQPVLCVSTVCL